MPFKWVCANCDNVNFYKGDKTTTANSTCSNPKCKKTQKIWSKRVISLPTKSNQIQPKKLEVPTITEDLTLGADLNRRVIIEGLNDTIRIYKNAYVTREGSRVSKKKAVEGKKVLEWVERYESQLSVPLLVTYHPYFVRVLAAYQELKKLRV